MKTLHAIQFATKKRTNQKKWDYQPVEYTFVKEDCNPVANQGINNEKSKWTRTIYRNVPDDISVEEFKAVLKQMIVMTPFGMQCLEYDARDILTEYHREIMANPPNKYPGQHWSFIYHPKKSA